MNLLPRDTSDRGFVSGGKGPGGLELESGTAFVVIKPSDRRESTVCGGRKVASRLILGSRFLVDITVEPAEPETTIYHLNVMR